MLTTTWVDSSGNPKNATQGNTNKLLTSGGPYHDTGAYGVKTGGAGHVQHCLVAAVERCGVDLIAVVLASDTASDNRYKDITRMLDFAFERLVDVPATTTRTVTSTSDTGPGSLREAIEFANTCTHTVSISIDPALSGQTINLLSPSLQVSGNLVIDGSALSAPVILNGQDGMRIFLVESTGDLTLRSLVIRDGRTSSAFNGAGLVNNGITTIEDCTFSSNRNQVTGDGGAIYNVGTLTVRQSLFDQNTSGGSGGAIANLGLLRIEGSTFNSNTSEARGGAIDNISGGTLTIIDTSFASNEAGSNAGAIHCSGTSSGGVLELLAINCSFINNYSASTAGAVYNLSANTKWQNCTFFGNESESGGGGCFYNSGSYTELDNCTVVSNLTDGPGGAIRNNSASNAHLRNTILWSNSASGSTSTTSASVANANGSTGSTYNHCLIDNSGGSDSWASSLGFNLGGNLDTDPQLALPGVYGGSTTSLPPLTASPVIDIGSSSLLPADTEDLDGDSDISEDLPTDQRGFSRVTGSAVDIGAVEIQPTLVSTTDDSGSGSLRHVVDSATPGSTITFDPGTFDNGATITLTSGQVIIDRDLTIDASGLAGAGDPTTKVTLSGGNNNRVLQISGGAQVIIDTVDVIEGSSDNGGGINVGGSGSQLTLRNARIAGNDATGSSGDGGGVAVSGTFIAENCLFEGNTAVDGGGGLRIYSSGFVTLENCTFYDNEAATGAGIHATNDLNALHCTIVGNSASSGGGIRIQSVSSSAPLVTLTNCIVAGNTATGTGPDIYRSSGTLTPAGANLIGDGNDPVDPLLGPLSANGGPTMTLRPLVTANSPVIGKAVDTGSLPLTDQRGLARINGSFPDLGAVEVEPATGFHLTSAAPSVAEGDTLQLEAVVEYIEGSSPIPFPEVTIDSLSGPLSSVSFSGLLTPDAVYEDTTGMVDASWSGLATSFALTVLDTDDDNFGVVAGDGVPDDWQVQRFTEAGLANALAHLDPDKDKQNNEFEWLAGSDPTDPGSFLSTNIVDVQQVEGEIYPGLPAPVTQFRFLLSHTTTHTHYRILHSPSGLGPWSPLTNDYLDYTDVDLGPDGFEIEAFHLDWTDKGFFRLELSPRE